MDRKSILDDEQQQDPQSKANTVGPTIPQPSKYNSMYFEKTNNLLYKKYLNTLLGNINKEIKNLNISIKSAYNQMKCYEEMETYSRKYEQQDQGGTGRGAASAMNGARNEIDSVNMSLQRTKLIQQRNTIINILR